MPRTLVTTKGAYKEPDTKTIKQHLKLSEEEGFWLDIESPDDDDYKVLQDVFGFHTLAIEDVKHRNQRPKLEEFKGYAFLVLFQAQWTADDMTFLEHHQFIAKDYLVTVHLEPANVLTELRDRLKKSPELTKGSPGFLTYLVVDTLVDSLFPTLEMLDDHIDDLQDRILKNATPQLLGEITSLKHDVLQLRKYIGAQRDMFNKLTTHSIEVQGGDDLTLYWRDVYDHLVRQYETVDSLRDLLTGAMDVYLSTVSNRLNVTTKTLTVIASLFLPLSWLTGFYGMNFTYLTGTLEPPVWAFWVAVGTMVAALVIQVYLFRRRGWF
jgi:magnesium transporter